MESSGNKRRFPPPWRVEETAHGFVVRDANRIPLATVAFDDHVQRFPFGHGHLTSDEARRIAYGIARLPEFLMQRRGFYERGSGVRWHHSRPYHVALEEQYIRSHWAEIDELCKFNSIPNRPTGEHIRDGALWCVYEFTFQLDAILFWDRFDGRWLRGAEFHYPERPANLPVMKEPPGFKRR